LARGGYEDKGGWRGRIVNVAAKGGEGVNRQTGVQAEENVLPEVSPISSERMWDKETGEEGILAAPRAWLRASQ